MSPRPDHRRAHSPLALVVAVFSLVAGMLTFAPAAPAQAADLPSSILEGGFIISDAEFFDSGSMTAAQIQTFLNGKVSTCRAAAGDPTCLKSFTTDLPKIAADKYCTAIAAKKGATAAQVIAAVTTACGINPKVILVMLQKEQGLVTSTAPSDWSYRAALGQACPDTAPCDEAAAGFVNQVHKGARQLQVYTQNPNSFNYRAGQVNTIKWHPTSSCGSSKVFIQNQATANLYIYTPYRPNVAALAAGSGTGDTCSSYGNRNFYNYYVSWFAPDASSSTGAPAQVAACTVPASADIAAASGTATATTATTGKKAPTKNCTASPVTLAKNAKVTVTGAYGAWMRVKTSSATTWVLKSSLKLAAAASPAAGGDVCALPSEASVTKASGTAVVATPSLNARKAPTTTCETGKTQITLGAEYPRTATYGVWWRITIKGTPYWVHSGYTALKQEATPAPVPTPQPTPTPAPSATPTPTPTPTASASPTPTPTPTASATPAPPDETTPVSKTMYTKNVVHLRKAAASSTIVSSLVKGTKATVTATKSGWSKVTVGSSKGWIESARLVAKKPAAVKASTLQTKKATVVRVALSSKSKKLKTLAKGTKVTVYDSTAKWRAVKVGSVTGWVLSSTVGAVPKKTMQTTTALNLRAKASTSSKIITTLKKSTKVTVTSSSGVWRKVTVASKTGWVHSKYLKAVPTKVVKTTTTGLNLRATASTKAKIITVLKKGTKVTVTASSGKWRKVTAGSKKGWVHSDYLK